MPATRKPRSRYTETPASRASRKRDSPIHPFGYSPIHPFGYSPIPPFGYSFGYSPIHPFGYSPSPCLSVSARDSPAPKASGCPTSVARSFAKQSRKRPRAASVSGGHVRPEGPKEPVDALRACSKMRGDRFFRVGASRLTRPPASVVARQRTRHASVTVYSWLRVASVPAESST